MHYIRRYSSLCTNAWEQRKLGELCEVKDSARVPNSLWGESGIPYIRASDLSNNNMNGVLFLSPDTFDFYSTLTGNPVKGDVLFNGGGEIGKAYAINGEIAGICSRWRSPICPDF